jgi:lysophospholipase L1-like esterase
MARASRPSRARILRLGLAVLLAAAAAEAALRAAGQLYLRHLYTTAFRATNPRPGDVNLLCLGESSTAGMGVDPADSYPGQLQARLREFYDEPRIRAIVPPHVGQNTSQMANRIRDYLELYQPRLVVVMAGFNNEWSLAESHVARHLEGAPSETWRVRGLIFLDGFRLFKLLRYGYLRFLARERSDYIAENAHYVWGHPELVRFPPEAWIHEVARRQSPAFVRAWREDVESIVHASRGRGARVLLMTYHLNPSYLPSVEFTSLAEELRLPLVRNDQSFEALARPGSPARYLLHDGWHPNRLGYELIARNAFERIRDEDLLGLVGAPAVPVSHSPAPYEPRAAAALGGRLELGDPASGHYLGRGWGEPEAFFRWTDGPRAEVYFRLDPGEARVLRLKLAPFVVAGRLDAQRVELALNGRPVATLRLAESTPSEHAVVLPGALLAHANALSLLLPDRRSPHSLGLSEDRRELGAAVEWLALERLPHCPAGGVQLDSPKAEPHLGDGWGPPDDGYRWTEGPHATLFFRTDDRSAGVLRVRLQPYLRPPALPRQRVGLELDGEPLAWFSLETRAAREVALAVFGPGRDRTLTLRLPDARSPATVGDGSDQRPLGVAVSNVRLDPFPSVPTGGRIDLGSATANPHLVRGWSDPLGGERWARPPAAEVAFRLGSPGPALLRLRARGFANAEERDLPVTVQLNGHRVASLRLTRRDPFPTTYAFLLASEIVASDNLLALGFGSETAGDSAESEPAGLALEWLEIVPGSGEP